ncbi:putative zinc-binding metallopeptidase [Flavobacterium sp. A45]|uniref:zinc-binding metallopeptidase n=1 Tax=Flavobacterium sp. A45 TaxID=1945862 RepID=UPI000985F35E|nr:putative zinc-binding metallopeptidase [Flavobacterium sp. A45]
MKILQQYRAMAFVAGILSFASCAHEDTVGESQLDYTQTQKTTLDNWIDENYINPYNINAQYRWNQNSVEIDRFLFPPKIDKVQPALEAAKKIWIDSYNTIGGFDFVKKVAPREIVLVGGINSNSNGTNTLGLAESGQKITFFEVNNLDLKNRTKLLRFVGTVLHEYTHILNQNKPFDEKAWQKITPGDYTASWNNYTEANSRNLGFVSSYARSNVMEDFAETASALLKNSKAEYAAILAGITDTKGVEKLKQKEAIVVQYYKESFNIDLYALRDEVSRNTTSVLTN